ncbi:MAG TPA: winged helix-turn-helix domain-containing protein [Rhodanobacteraceae bacterium]|nr:winged helix-turn-helix domain-containing protein [Rhodanobacteraceae bacterium]
MQTVDESDSTPIGWRFGAFELYPAQRRLLRDGATVDVEERAFDLLVLLAENHQRELERSEVTERLWGKRPVSDNTLRQVLYKARRAVDDDGAQQQIIRTLHGRSLCWVAPLQGVDGAAPSSPLLPRPVSRRRAGWWLTAAVTLLALAGLWLDKAYAPDEAALPRLAIAPFENQTGDAAMDWTINGLPGLIAGLLGQAGGIDVVDPLRSARAWKYQPQQGRNRVQQLRYVTGAGAVIGGRLRKLAADMFELDLHVQQADQPALTFAVTGPKPGVLAANAVLRIRRALHLSGRETLASLPHDPFLSEAYARGMDQAGQGNWSKAREYFQLVAEGAPQFLNGRLNLGIAQLFTDKVADGKQTLAALAQSAERQHDTRARMLALLWQARSQRDDGTPDAATVGLREVARMAKAAQDAEVEIEARAMLADAVYKLGQHEAARQELAAAESLAVAHPQLLDAHAVLYDVQSEIANGDGDLTTALAVAQKVLALRESMGDRRGVLVSKFYVGQALYSQGRDAEALTLAGRAYRDATAAGDMQMRYTLGALVAATLLDLGLDRAALAAAREDDQLGRQLDSGSDRLVARQMAALAEMQQADFAAALKTLRDGAALVDMDTLGHEDYFNQMLYTALASYVADPHALPQLLAAFDARHASYGSDPWYAVRQAQLQALVAAAAQQPRQAQDLLHKAASLPAAKQDQDVERRLAPLLIALAANDADLARFALAGYAPRSTPDANILPTYIRWAEQSGGHAAAEGARERLMALQAQGTAALAAAGLDPAAPLGNPAASPKASVAQP